MIPICSVCRKLRNEKESWFLVEAYFNKHGDVEFLRVFVRNAISANGTNWKAKPRAEKRHFNRSRVQGFKGSKVFRKGKSCITLVLPLHFRTVNTNDSQ